MNNYIDFSIEYQNRHIIKLIILSVAVVGTMTTWFSMTAILPELKTLWGLTDTQGSYLTIMVNIGFVVGSLLSALINLPDRIYPHILFFLSALLAGVTTLITVWLATDLISGMFFRFITGMALAGVYGPALKLISTWFKKRRGMALGFVVGAITVGSASPHLIKGLGASWEVVLIITGLSAVFAGVLVIFFVNVGPYSMPRGKFDLKAIPHILSYRPVRLSNYGYFGHMWELYGMWSWFGVFLTHSLKNSNINEHASLLTFLIIASGFFGAWFGGIFADKYSREQVSLWSLGISGSISLIIGFFLNITWVIIFLGIIWGISIISDSAQFSALVTEYVDQRYVGTALTLQLAIGYILTIFVIFLIPLIETLVGWHYTFIILVPGSLFGFISMLRLNRDRYKPHVE